MCVLPVAIMLVLMAFFALDKLMLIMAFLVPLSIPLSEIIEGLPIDMFLPTEPLLACILLLFIIKLIHENCFDKRILTHPVSIAIYLYLTWMLITSITSVDPVVSLKHWISRVWFIVAFYFIMTQVFRNNHDNAKKYITLYSVALSIVIIYATLRHIKYSGVNEKIIFDAANPFYKDHTSYGALISFYIPPIAALCFENGIKKTFNWRYLIILCLLIVGLILSYSRAAWVSLVGALGIWFCIKHRIKFSTIMLGVTILLAVVLSLGHTLVRDFQANDQDSSTNIVEHIQSISNISTDASNLERINRWKCAIRMFQEKPIFGWGPGTYMFYYAPFQVANERTIISTNNGDLGNAHSEYLGPLCEQGFMGPILLILVIITTIVTGIRAIRITNNTKLSKFGIAIIVGLCTYYAHGVLNNFLDTDKASAPFWGFTAILVAIDVYYTNRYKADADESPKQIEDKE